MPWWAWILLALYIVGMALAFRRITGQFAWHMAENHWRRGLDYPTGEMWFGAMVTGFFLAFVWPLSLPVAIGLASAHEVESRGFYRPPNVRERLYRERIEQLEREAGIR